MFVFVIRTVEYEIICCFCFQATIAKWINGVFKWVFEIVVRDVAKVHAQSCEVFYSLRIVALKNNN